MKSDWHSWPGSAQVLADVLVQLRKASGPQDSALTLLSQTTDKVGTRWYSPKKGKHLPIPTGSDPGKRPPNRGLGVFLEITTGSAISDRHKLGIHRVAVKSASPTRKW